MYSDTTRVTRKLTRLRGRAANHSGVNLDAPVNILMESTTVRMDFGNEAVGREREVRPGIEPRTSLIHAGHSANEPPSHLVEESSTPIEAT